ncbi:MAG: hypothetical protein ACR2ML_02125 [Solirubrobacteraceae bacterium]
MSVGVLTILTLVEAVVLVAVLALFLILLAARLNSIADNLAKVDSSVAGVEKDLGILNVGAPFINVRLQTIAGVLPGIAEKAERLAARQRR